MTSCAKSLTVGRRLALLAVLLAAVAAGVSAAGTVPGPVFQTVHGRVVGWAKAGSAWFAVYVDRRGTGWCGLDGASWRMALVETRSGPWRVVGDRAISGAMCGNELAWTKAGRFSDGRHEEVAFMLWQTPSIGAWTYLYRIEGNRFSPLAKFGGDKVVLGHGTVTVSYENRGRSRHGELRDVYRFEGGRYRLVSRT
jgi:hypothetical protein